MPIAVHTGTPIRLPSGVPTPEIELPINFIGQGEARNLCWAACGAMIFEASGHGEATVCQVTSAVFGYDCCNTSICDVPYWPQAMYDHFQFTYEMAGGPLTAQALNAWIGAGWPIQVYYQWRDSAGEDAGSHTALIVGLYSNGDLLVFDPEWGIARKTWNDIYNAYNMGYWRETWYYMRPRNAAIS